MNERRNTVVERPAAAARVRSDIVVGVDGTAANWSAVSWAVAEARATGRPLRLVAASTWADAPASAPLTENLEREHLERLTRELLDDVRSRVSGTRQDISTHVTTGEPAHALLATAAPVDLLVVGKRGGHPLSRMVLGSTSMAVAGRCRGLLVVVPEGWSAGEHARAPVVAGIDGDRDPQVLDFAFLRSQRLGVPLVVVHASGSSRSSIDALSELAAVVAPWQQRHPAVSVRFASHPLTPTVALLGAATDAQLLVLGRHTGPEHLGGLALASTTRRVLHHAPCPVVVVPEAAPLILEDVDEQGP
jgi:nucleotide-binding universal stress UspA family protein